MGSRKQSFTYSGDPKTRRDAIRNAKKEGKNFSELVEGLLQDYVKATSPKTDHLASAQQEDLKRTS